MKYSNTFIRKETYEKIKAIAEAEKRKLKDQLELIVSEWLEVKGEVYKNRSKNKKDPAEDS